VPAVQATPPANSAATRARLPSVSEAEALRLAAARRARDKAEREAKVKAAIEQREQAVARLKAEQDNGRRRTEEQQRSASPAPPRAAPAAAIGGPAPLRTVREICAGRNAISQAICESRLCGSAEHAGEAACRQIRANEERRRDLLN
jgi:hypothetical protein